MHIDPDIRRARTLPSALYHTHEWWQLQRERLFPSTWHAFTGPSLPNEAEALEPWSYLPGCLDEPLLLARAEDRLRLLSNVCTHRGNTLVHERCKAATLRCRYHGRRFSLDGKMTAMPEFEQALDFPSEADHLPEVELHAWGGLGFASLAPAKDLVSVLAHVERRTSFMPVADFVPMPERSRSFEFDANWALYCDNYLEGFHIPFVHPSLRTALDYESYETETFDGGVLQTGIAASGEPCFSLPSDHPDHGRSVGAYYFWLFPCTMLNFYPWGLSVNVVLPQGPTRTKVLFFSRVWKPELLDQGAGSGLDAVEMEDEEVVLAVQRGVRSSLYDRGRYSPTRERGVHHFHRMLVERLGGLGSAEAER